MRGWKEREVRSRKSKRRERKTVTRVIEKACKYVYHTCHTCTCTLFSFRNIDSSQRAGGETAKVLRR